MDKKDEDMHRKRRGSTGSIAVEFAVILPILCFLVIGGWVLGYMAYTKVALAMVANRAARDLAAATKLNSRLTQPGTAYRYDVGFAESFGLPRWGIHALAMKSRLEQDSRGEGPSDHAIVVAVCYRVPFAVPFGVLEKPAPAPTLPDTGEIEEAALLVGDLTGSPAVEEFVVDGRREIDRLNDEIAAWDRLLDRANRALEQGKDVWAKGEWIFELGEELIKGSEPDFTKYRSGVEPEQLEGLVAQLCAPPGQLSGESVVMTSRAAYLMQKVW